MDVLLLTSVDPSSYQIIPDLGLMYLASALRDTGYDVSILDCRREGLDYDDLADRLEAMKPGIVGIKSYSNEAGRVARMASVARKVLPESVIVIGGPHPSLDPIGCLESMKDVDYAFLGESERSLPGFVEWIKSGGSNGPPSTVKGIAYRGPEEITVREPEFSEDLSDLPVPAWDLMPPDTYPDEAAGIFVPGFPAAPIMLSRGCPFRCSYCGGRYIMGGRLRYRPVESIMEEIDLLQSKYGVKTFTFVDDSFTCNHEKAIEVFEALAARSRKIHFTFPNGIRVDSLDLRMLDAMERAGCYSLALGIESGSDETLERMKKKQSTGLIRAKVKLIRQNSGIKVTGFFILGYPGETIEEVKGTIRFAVELPIHHAHFCLFIPIPGTPVFDELTAEGCLSGRACDPEDLTIDRASLELPGLPPRKLLRLHQYAYLRFYLTPWRTAHLLSQIKSLDHLKVILRRFRKLWS